MGMSLSSYAGEDIQACQYIDVQITTVQLLDGSDAIELPEAKSVTDCIGAYVGVNSSFEQPIENLGYDEDGWLNKESYNDWWDGPGAFVDQADLLDLDGDGDADDPGWVYVGKDEGNGFVGEVSSDGSSSYTFIDDLITFDNCKKIDGSSSKCIGGDAVSGTWTYTPPDINPTALTDLLGGDFFDQVAIVFKAGTTFAIYNFSIADLGLDPVLAGDYNFAFTGTWDISDVLAGKGLSNVSFWARDPVGPTEVPEPSTMILFLLSGILLFSSKKLKS